MLGLNLTALGSYVCSGLAAEEQSEQFLQAITTSTVKAPPSAYQTRNFTLSETANILFIVDTSQAMRGKYPDGRALFDQTVDLLSESVERIPKSTKIGLRIDGLDTNFDNVHGTTKLVVPLASNNKREVLTALQNQQPSSFQRSLTHAVRRAVVEELQEAEGNSIVVVLTDGNLNDKRTDPTTYLGSKPIKIIIVNVNDKPSLGSSRSMSKTPSADHPDPIAYLKRLTKMTAGYYFDMTNLNEFRQLMKQVGKKGG